MSVATPTVLPRPLRFLTLLPEPPKPHPVPISRRRVYGHLNAIRDIQREMDDLSDEETELEEQTMLIHNRGFGWLIPIGRSLTQQEEKNDQADDTDESDSGNSNAVPSVLEDDGENESAQDLDASMEDLDDEDVTGDTEDTDDMNEEDTPPFDASFDEETSDFLQ
ncbi:hypothetical protein BDQ12DRAFT_676124 [Crucibulum laeve]|uniref:Uncharacterized protein n=1 Tax=Crucibulum laeve TaxID=68775 RepID=A0A5C3MAX3_9AGAR|nr:hypothetical protein BDQ12DRAFT_676124 [Crucibulum laeve]